MRVVNEGVNDLVKVDRGSTGDAPKAGGSEKPASSPPLPHLWISNLTLSYRFCIFLTHFPEVSLSLDESTSDNGPRVSVMLKGADERDHSWLGRA